MAESTIELVRNYEPNKMPWPALAQIKLDGVPVKIIRTGQHALEIVTRPGTKVTSLNHLRMYADALIPVIGGSFTGEMWLPKMPFKDISGLVRQRASNTDSEKLIMWVHDFDIEPVKGTYIERRDRFNRRLKGMLGTAGKSDKDIPIRLLGGIPVNNDAEAQAFVTNIMQLKPDAEGVVLHSLQKRYSPGERTWSTQRIKGEPTIDLLVTGFEEARSGKSGDPLGMVGRVMAEFTTMKDGQASTDIIGIGPGALTHKQRKHLWEQFKRGLFKPAIAQIKYMPDNTYVALRQPTFMCWREDKEEADVG